MTTKKSNSGKKKKNPNQLSPSKPAMSPEEQQVKKKMDKFSFYWLSAAILYFGCMVISWQLAPESNSWKVVTILCYGALLLWGGILFVSAKHFQKKQTAIFYRIAGGCLILMGLFKIMPFFTGTIL